jgi:hypothetical protein
MMKNKKSWITIIILVLLLGGCFGDRVISEVVFAYHCKKDVGVFVYETVELDGSYVVPIPEDIRKRDSRFNVSDTEMIDYKKINKDYEIKFYEKKVVSSFGPVQSIKTSITKKNGGQIIAKVVTFRNNMGWASNLGSNITTRRHCPPSNNKNSRSINNQFHEKIIRKVFTLNEQGE